MTRSFAMRLVAKFPPHLQDTAKQFIKFGVVGVIGAVVDFGTYNIMTRLLGWTDIYHVFGYEIIAANLVSVFLAIVSNFLLNKYWTFRDTDEKVVQQWSKYFALNFTTFIFNQILTSFFAFRVPLVAIIFGSQKDNIAKALAIGIILFVNFAGSKFLIFRRSKPVETSTPSPLSS